MQSIVLSKERPFPTFLERVLPTRLVEEIYAVLSPGVFPEEIRLRRERCASLTAGQENLCLHTVLSAAEMDALLPRFAKARFMHTVRACAKDFLP